MVVYRFLWKLVSFVFVTVKNRTFWVLDFPVVCEFPLQVAASLCNNEVTRYTGVILCFYIGSCAAAAAASVIRYVHPLYYYPGVKILIQYLHCLYDIFTPRIPNEGNIYIYIYMQVLFN